MKKVVLFFLALSIVALSGCSSETEKRPSAENSTSSEPSKADVSFKIKDDDIFTERDLNAEYDENKTIKITLKGNTAFATDKTVNISGTTISITKEASYLIEGELTDGTIVVNAPDTAKIQLFLKNTTVNNSCSAPLYIKNADKVFITLIKDTENTFTAGSFSAPLEAGIDSAIYGKSDITFNGQGKLKVSAKTGHGIATKDDLAIVGGKFEITSAYHGIKANDSIRIKDANITVNSGKDGMHAENTDDDEKGFIYINGGDYRLTTEGDGISASSTLQFVSGSADIIAGGGYENATKEHSDGFGQFGGGHGGMPPEMGGIRPGRREITENSINSNDNDDTSTSMKGIKSGGNLLISAGNFIVNSADDAVHTNSSMFINNGVYKISSGDDAFHADQNIEIAAGSIEIFNSYEGIEAINIIIKGGNIVLKATDDGINAAGGNDSSGNEGGRDGMFGKPGYGGMSSNSNGSVVISGGKINITASGDGIDANGTIDITGGETTVTGPTNGDTATLDYDKTCNVTGGSFIGTGARNMAQSFSKNTQGVIAVSVGNTDASTKITLTDKKGNTVLTHSPTLDFNVVIISTPNIKSGENYVLKIGTSSDTVTAE